MEMSHFREVNKYSSDQKFSRTSWNLEALGMIHKNPPFLPTQSQINTVDAVPNFPKINLNILFPSSA
jgi:hypothetical protein